MTRRIGRVTRSDVPGGSAHATHAGVGAGKAANFAAALDRAQDRAGMARPDHDRAEHPAADQQGRPSSTDVDG